MIIFIFFGRAVSWILNDKYSMKNESFEKVHTMVDNIKSVFSDLIANNEVDWADEETKINIFIKNSNMKFQIGYPDSHVKSEVIDDYYKNVR